MKLRYSMIGVAAVLAACSESPTTPVSMTPAPGAQFSAVASGLTIDEFNVGSVTLAACGTGQFNYTQDAGIIGGARELYTRDAGSCHNGGSSQAKAILNAAAGTLTWGGANTYSSEYAVTYGTLIGHGQPTWMASPNVNKGTPLNLAFTLGDKLRIEMAQVYALNPGVRISLKSGTGAVYSKDVSLVTGTNLIPLSGFGMSAAAAADIDGIMIQTFGLKDPGDIFASFGAEGSDNSPPVIAASVSGTAGVDGWYTGDVSVSWSVTDADSPVTSKNGCDATSVTTDTDGETITCTATSAGGTQTQSVTVKRDATSPTVTYSGNAGTYSIDQSIQIACSADDATNPGSGLKSSTCANVSGAAYSFAIGSNSVSATALDNAGNTGAGSATFTVVVSGDALCSLATRWVNQAGNGAGVANSLCVKVTHGQVGAFISEVGAQSGKKIAADKAAILVALARQM